MHLQLAFPRDPQVREGGREVVGEDCGVDPRRVGERGRRYVFGLGVQRRRDGVIVRIDHRSPVSGEDLVGVPAEQERVGALVDPVQKRRGLVVVQRHGPSTAFEPAPTVLVRGTESLHHAVDGDPRGGGEPHDRGPFLLRGTVGNAFGSRPPRETSPARAVFPMKRATRSTTN